MRPTEVISRWRQDLACRRRGASRESRVSSSGRDEIKNRVLQATNLVGLIGRTVALKKRGNSFIGLCPFHQEKSPSFNVHPDKQFYKCFGCGKGGNAIDFVIERDRVEFKEALRMLAEAA